MGKSLLYAVNTNVQTVAVDGKISFGAPVRRYGCNVNSSDGNIILSGTGYYDIAADVTFTAGAAGTATITLYADNASIPGAVATFTTVGDTIYQIRIPGNVVREKRCCCDTTTNITAILSGVAGTVTLSSIKIIKE